MSAALQLPTLWASAQPAPLWTAVRKKEVQRETAFDRPVQSLPAKAAAKQPLISLAFYRRHTESLLRRYLYASMQVGRAPSILCDPVGRGWASSRPVRTFEDAIIFVLDVERCLDRLGALDRQMLSRVILQEYTQAEAAVLLGMSTRTMSYKFPQAIDNLTEKLLKSGLLILPH